MPTILGLEPQTALLIAAALLFALWWLARSPRLTHGDAVPMTVFCLRCNWEGRVRRGSPKCGRCGGGSVSVLTV